jgi:hypothetical protein
MVLVPLKKHVVRVRARLRHLMPTLMIRCRKIQRRKIQRRKIRRQSPGRPMPLCNPVHCPISLSRFVGAVVHLEHEHIHAVDTLRDAGENLLPRSPQTPSPF